MKLIQESAQKLTCKSNSCGIPFASFVLTMAGLILLLLLFPNLIECLRDKVCYKVLMSFHSTNMLQYIGGSLIGILMIALGLFLFLQISTRRVVFDLEKNQLDVEKYWIFTRNLDKRQYLLSEIYDVTVDICKQEGEPDAYQVVVLLNNGTSILLDLSYTGNEEWHQETAKVIKNFLSL